LIAFSCARRPASAGPARVAILRFENLSSDPSIDWMGRAFSEVISRELASVPGTYAIPFEKLHRLEPGFESRPLTAPGISTERSLALAAGANRIGYGEYWNQGGRLEARLLLEDPETGKMMQVLSASSSSRNPIDVASRLTRQIASQLSSQVAPYPTEKPGAVEAYVAALDSPEITTKTEQLEQAIEGDSGFAPPYLLLAQFRAQRQDRAGAVAVLDRALSHAGGMPAADRARIEFERATLRGDTEAAKKSLTAWTQSSPNDPLAWSAAATAAMGHHQYVEAAPAYQKALAIDADDVNGLNQLGYAAAYAGDWNTATQALIRYQNLRPADVNPLDSLGDINLAAGRLREAENFYLQATKKNPTFLNGAGFFKAAMARLMTGDRAGADKIEEQYIAELTSAKDPLVEVHKAVWAWSTGRRKQAYQELAAFAASTESGPLHELASQAYSQLAIWAVTSGDRSDAAKLAGKAVMLAGPGTAGLAAAVRFLGQPSASAADWAARAEQSFPQPALKGLKETALTYALLADQQYQAAADLLKEQYDRGSATVDDGLPVLLAWTYLETGKPKEAAALLRFNPIPPTSGVRPFSVFYFPRLFYLRGRVAQLAGSGEAARTQFGLFRQLSGDEPLR
jgi:tetratricopeptide (TPR) repeat protein